MILLAQKQKKRKRRRTNKTGFPRKVPKKKNLKMIRPSGIGISVKPNPIKANYTGLQGDYWKQPSAKKRGAQKSDEICPIPTMKKKVEKTPFLSYF